MNKANLHCGEAIREGYLNSDVRVPDLPSDYFLSRHIDNSINEIIAHAGCVESVERDKVVELFQAWLKKLRSGGVLKLSFLDMKKLANAYCYDRVQINEFEASTRGMSSFHDMLEMRAALIALGYKVKFSDYSIQDYIGTIHAEK